MRQLSYKSLLIVFFAITQVTIVKSQEKLTVLSYNVYEGFQKDSLQKEKFKKWVQQFHPDVIAFQELNGFTHTLLEELAASYGHSYVVLQKDWGYPVGITSRYPITDIEKRSDDFTMGYIYGRIMDYHFFVIHLNPFQYQKRLIQINSVLAQADRINKKEKIIILGDFNSLSSSDSLAYAGEERMQMIKKYESLRSGKYDDFYVLKDGKIDYSTVDAMKAAGYTDAFELHNKQFTSSCATQKYSFREGPNGKDIRIDYIWLNKPLRNKSLSATIIKDEITHELSDHYPMILELKQ